MRPRWLLAPLALIASGQADAKDAISWPSGLYSNVRMSKQTGDLGGLEARFYEEAGRHMVEFAYCEGWCNETHVSEVKRDGEGFVFAYDEIFTGAGGDEPIEIRFVVRPAGNRLAYSTYQGKERVDYNGKPSLMRRATKPFGIAVAKSGKE